MAGIIVVFPKIEDSKAIRNLLVHNGYDNVFHCNTGAKAITLADSLGEGVIISGFRMPDMPYTDILDYVEGRFEMLLVAQDRNFLKMKEEWQGWICYKSSRFCLIQLK